MLGPLLRIRGQHYPTSWRVPVARLWERGRSRRMLFAVPALMALVAAVLVPVSSSTASGQTNPSDWPSYMDGPGHGSYNAAATSITAAGIQAGNLQPVWRWTVPASTNTGQDYLRASPTVVKGVVYIGANDGMFYALSETTRKVLWSDYLGLDTSKGGCGPQSYGIISTAAVVTDPATGNLTVYVFGPTGTLYALNAATGATVWTAQVDTESTTKNDYYSWGSPLVVNDHVYIGTASACGNPQVAAGLAEYNQSTGAQLGFWHSLPAGQVGASIWSSPAEEPGGTVIATTGNGLANTGQPLYDESVVRLTGPNLTFDGAWQLPPSQQVSDTDFGASPAMFTADLNGTSTPMVGACNKNGVFYAFRQSAIGSGPVWQATVAIPYPGSYEECIAAAIWNGTSVIVSGGAPTTIGGKTYLGSVQALNPATGKPLWQTGMPGFVLGTPTEDGAGVIAVQLYAADTDADMGIYLLNASNGQIIGTIPLPKTSIFSQPVFAGNDLLVAGLQYLTAYEITNPGAAVTGVAPSTVGVSTTGDTLTLTGSGFSGTPRVFVSGTLVNVTAVNVLSPTSLSVTVSVSAAALAGARNITVIEPGSSPYTANTCTGCLTVTAPDTTTLTSSGDPSTYQQAVTLTATVSNGTSTPPTGTVSFMDGSTTLGTGTLNSSGVATFTTSTLPAGPATIDAVYGGDSSNPTSTSNDITQAVDPDITVTSLASSLNPSTYGQSVTLTATVNVKNGGFTPTGVVNFYNGNTFLADVTLTNGTGTFTTSALPAGTDTLKAIYPGGGDAAGSPSGPLQGVPSTSNTVKEVISPASTTTSLSSSLNPSTYGQAVTLTATVANGSSTAPTGTVTFLNGTTTLGTGTLSGGVATFATSALPAGTDQITASYGGDANDTSSVSSALAQVVNPASTTTSLSSSLNPSTVGQSVTFTAVVSNGSSVVPTGTVTFLNGTTTLGTGTLDSTGTATFATSTLPAGTDEITASYGGDANDTSSVSSALAQVVNSSSGSAFRYQFPNYFDLINPGGFL
jgi:outer membrane protein assembly factor BamB